MPPLPCLIAYSIKGVWQIYHVPSIAGSVDMQISYSYLGAYVKYRAAQPI